MGEAVLYTDQGQSVAESSKQTWSLNCVFVKGIGSVALRQPWTKAQSMSRARFNPSANDYPEKWRPYTGVPYWKSHTQNRSE